MATVSVAAVLGGKGVLGGLSRPTPALAQLVREGLPAESLLRLAERLDLRQA